jgi:predicted outer membrane protein
MFKASSIAGAFALTLVAAVAASCSGDDTVVTSTADAGGSGGTTPPDASVPADASTGDAVVEAVQEPQIAQVLLTVNRRELDQSQIAATYAVTPQVQTFASLMVDEYTAINARQEALFVTLGLTPTGSSTSRQLQSESDDILQKLQLLPNDFERVYIDAQVANHAEVLNLIDRQLLPAAASDGMQAELTALRAAVSSHLDAARTVQSALSGL